MENAHCSKSNFFEKNCLNILCQHIFPPPRSLKRLEKFFNLFCFQVVLEMKYCSEMDNIVVALVAFGWGSFLDF